MTRIWLSVQDESRLLDEVAQRQQRLHGRVRSVTPQMGQMASDYGDAYPWMDPTLVQSMIQFGVQPDSPQAQEIATLAAQQAADSGELDTPGDDLADPWYESLWNTVTDWAKPIVRTGFTALSTPWEEIQALVASVGATVWGDQAEGGPDEMGFLEGMLPWNQIARNVEITTGQREAGGTERLAEFWTNYTQKAARSGGLLALGDLLEGRAVDLGQGFLPGGQIYEERERAKMNLTVDGDFITLGRLIARDVTEPGTTAYNVASGLVDAGAAIFADPTGAGLGAVGRGAQRARTFQATGVLNGIRRTVDPATAVNHYLTSNTGRRMVRYLTENQDVETAWKAIGEADIGVAERLARTRSDTETFGVLRDVLGTQVRQRPTASFVSRQIGGPVGLLTGGPRGAEYGRLFGGGAAVRRAGRNSRLWAEMPGQVLNVDNINDAARHLDRWARNARLPEEVRKSVLNEVATLSDGDSVGLFNVTRRLMRHTETELVDRWGVLPSRARKLTQMYEDLSDDLVAFAFDDVGRHVDVDAPFRPMIDGIPTELPRGQPMLISELVNDTIPLPPTARDIRRSTASLLGMDSQALSKLYNSKVWKVPVDGLDTAMSNVWKPFQLLRGAYTLRVIAEEQARMAGAGYDSMIRNPAAALAWSLSIDPSSRLGKKMAQLAAKIIDPKGTMTVTGDLFDDIAEHAAAMSRGNAGHLGLPGEILTGRYVKATWDDPDFFRGWSTELGFLGNDPIARRLAGGLSEGDIASIQAAKADWQPSGNIVDDVKEWFTSGSGKKFRNQIGRVEGRSAILTERRVADDYIDLIANRLQNSTGGNTELVDLIATGRLGDKINIRNFGSEQRLATTLEKQYIDARPVAVKKPETIRARGATSGWRRVIDTGFDTLMSKPTNWLSRSPVFRQSYWGRIEELVGSADEATQVAMVKAARNANVGKAAEERMASAILRGHGDQLTSLDEVDLLAKSFALDETKQLLYDLNKRSQFFDMARVIFPFGEAWKEIIGAWTGIVRKSPQVIRRFQQGLQGARNASVLPGATPGLTMPAGTTPERAEELEQEGFGRGFFHTDPNTGEEVFVYPSAWAGKLLSALPGPLGAAGEALADPERGVSLVGRAAGLNIVSATVLPGFGPAVQIPAAKLIPNTPKWDDVRDILLPFGAPQGDDVFEQIFEATTPAWFDKLRTSLQDPENHRLFANTVADVQRALLARGKHDISTLEGQQALYDEAVSAARGLYGIRALAQMNVPTGPSFQWNTTDVEGNVVPVKILSDEYRRLATEEYGGDWEMAFTEWVRRYGVDNVLALIGKSYSVKDRPVTEAGDDWLRAHPDLERDHDLVIGLFAPEPPAGEFDYNAYLRQFETGAREATSPAEQLALANDLLGRVQFEQVKQVASLRPGPQTNLWVAKMREEIAAAYPGFDGWVAESQLGKRPQVDQLVAEVRRAVQDPTLAATDAGQGIIKYLSAIQIAEGMVGMLPGNVKHYQQAKAAEPIRMFLRSVARQIIEEHPDFARVWDRVFSRELTDDDVGLGGVAA